MLKRHRDSLRGLGNVKRFPSSSNLRSWPRDPPGVSLRSALLCVRSFPNVSESSHYISPNTSSRVPLAPPAPLQLRGQHRTGWLTSLRQRPRSRKSSPRAGRVGRGPLPGFGTKFALRLSRRPSLTWGAAALTQFVLTQHTFSFIPNTLALFFFLDMPEGFP